MIQKESFVRELADTLGCPEQIDVIMKLLEKWENKERQERSRKQKIGIEKAKVNGVPLGRPKIQEPDNFEKICRHFINGKVTAAVAAETCAMGVSTFYRRVRKLRDEQMEEMRREKR